MLNTIDFKKGLIVGAVVATVGNFTGLALAKKIKQAMESGKIKWIKVVD